MRMILLNKKYFLSLASVLFLFSCGPQKAATSSPSNITQKYAGMLGVEKKDVANIPLYRFIDNWVGTPYQYGGKTPKGVDCSGFVTILYREVYGKEIGGSSAAIYKQCKTIQTKNLKEGDLVFFRIDSKEVSHIGVYLQNDRFVHASTKAGVRIDRLDDPYYSKYIIGGGR